MSKKNQDGSDLKLNRITREERGRKVSKLGTERENTRMYVINPK